MKLEVIDAFRLWDPRKAGDAERGLSVPVDIRDLKRRSKGRKEGFGLSRPGREATEGRILLPGEDMKEPCIVLVLSRGQVTLNVLEQTASRPDPTTPSQ